VIFLAVLYQDLFYFEPEQFFVESLDFQEVFAEQLWAGLAAEEDLHDAFGGAAEIVEVAGVEYLEFADDAVEILLLLAEVSQFFGQFRCVAGEEADEFEFVQEGLLAGGHPSVLQDSNDHLFSGVIGQVTYFVLLQDLSAQSFVEFVFVL
jgi:hypothetical protein